MTVYRNTPSKGKFQLLDDGTLGYPAKPDFSAIKPQTDNLAPVRQYESYVSPYTLPDKIDNVSHVDWFRATTVGSDSLFTVTGLQDLLTIGDDGEIDTDIEFQHINKGLHGYPEQYLINVNTDKGSMSVGSIAFEQNPNESMCGVMLDLGGKGLDYLRLNAPHKLGKLKDYLSGYDFRISRIDIALDLPGYYCRDNGLTVPVLLADHVDNRTFEPMSGSRSMLTQQYGDWSWNMMGREDSICYQDYNPSQHAPKGITAAIGSRQCANYIRVYEKAKQIISTAELGEDHDLDKWDLRIEQEIKKQRHLPPIPWDVLTHPDYFFMLGRPARAYLDSYRATLSAAAIEQAQKQRFERHKQLSLERKVFWGRRAYGRLVNTLLAEGMTKEDVCNMLTRDVGLKDFVYDIAAADTGFGTIDIDSLAGYVYDTSELAQQIRKDYGLWQDFLV
jgi:DNA relaxase NicK